MHIPDGFLSLPVVIGAGTVSAAFIYPSVKKIEKEITAERIPLMGLSAAFVFTAQLLSFPVLAGTSVHLTGAVLISILLGPVSGFLITTASVLLLALLFQHGGLLVSGANILNIAIIQSFLGYYVFRLFPARLSLPASFTAAFTGIVAASVLCAFELIASGTIPFQAGLTAMVLSHLFAGAAEGVITVLIMGMIKNLKPGLLQIRKI